LSPAGEPAPGARSATAATWLRPLVVAAALALALFAVLVAREASVAAWGRVHGELVHDRLGGAIVDHAVRAHRGLPIYAAPDDRFVSVVYTPLYYYVAAGMMALVGEGVLACRMTSALLVLASHAVALLLAWRITRSRRWTLLAVPVALAGYPLCEFFYDAPRVDPLSTFFVLLATFVAATGRGARSAVGLGFLLAAAWFAKLSTAAFSVVLLAGLALLEPRRAALAAVTGAAAGGAALAGLNAATQGWFWKYCVYLTTQHEFPAERVRAVLAEDARALAFPLVGLALAAVSLLRARPRSAEARPTAIVVLAALGTLAFSLASHARSGATIKVLMPFGVILVAALPVGCAWLTRRARGESGRLARAWLALLLVAGYLVQHRFVAAEALPAQEDLARWHEFLDEVEHRCAEGQVWVAPWGYVTTPIEGQGMRPNLIALEDYLGVKGNDTGLPFPEELAAAVREQRFAVIYCPLKGGNRDLREFLREHYEPLAEAREMVVGTNRFTMELGTFVPRTVPGRRRGR